MMSFKRMARSPAIQKAVGFTAAEYLRFVRKTSRLILDPPDLYQIVEPEMPVIVAMWHGQHFMMPFLSRGHRAKVLISRHRDGEINAIAAERLGIGTVRGSGDIGGRFDRKGGVAAFRKMLTALQEGYSMALTADIPKVSRVAGIGIVKLAQLSGRPIYPVAVTTSRRIDLNNWDHTAVNLPFSRFAIVARHPPIRVPAKASDAELETYRLAVQDELNSVTARAIALVDGQDGGRE